MLPVLELSRQTGNQCPKQGRTCLCRRVKEFQLCGRSAQMLILENGGWERLDEWLRAAIRHQNVNVIRSILEVLLQMPTSTSQLVQHKNELALTVQNLMAKLHKESIGMLDLVRDEDRMAIKQACAKVFVRWLKLKKQNHEEKPDFGRVEFEEVNTGKTLSMTPLAHRPGCGLVVIDGKFSCLDLRQFAGHDDKRLLKLEEVVKEQNGSTAALELIPAYNNTDKCNSKRANQAETPVQLKSNSFRVADVSSEELHPFKIRREKPMGFETESNIAQTFVPGVNRHVNTGCKALYGIRSDSQSSENLNVPWKVKKVHVPTDLEIEVCSDEAIIQREREKYVPMWTPHGLAEFPDSPFEPNEWSESYLSLQ